MPRDNSWIYCHNTSYYEKSLEDNIECSIDELEVFQWLSALYVLVD
ncbi:4098_t:CDS:2 [Scutellospora calospora]|uniref:4098_t:CDS:1 n=1 Tax=Scutellospora calospora TaxID=85575 RepID=A0ACA9MAQ3_9GLOM|nr:4098_t:CDS:2 [Scutellospora calospora]